MQIRFVSIRNALLWMSLLVSACQSASGPAIQVEEAWGRSSPMDASLGAIYMKILNTGDQNDTLLSASSAACGVIELHETLMEGDIMKMRPVGEGGIPIPAKGTVELKTGGLHIMCIDKQQDFSTGAKIPLTLQFEVSGVIDLQVEIRNP
jgi:periplasmic copper chaperone A